MVEYQIVPVQVEYYKKLTITLLNRPWGNKSYTTIGSISNLPNRSWLLPEWATWHCCTWSRVWTNYSKFQDAGLGEHRFDFALGFQNDTERQTQIISKNILHQVPHWYELRLLDPLQMLQGQKYFQSNIISVFWMVLKMSFFFCAVIAPFCAVFAPFCAVSFFMIFHKVWGVPLLYHLTFFHTRHLQKKRYWAQLQPFTRKHPKRWWRVWGWQRGNLMVFTPCLMKMKIFELPTWQLCFC